MVFAQHAPLHDFGKNKFTAKESNIFLKNTIFIFSAQMAHPWATGGTEQVVKPTYNPDLLLVHVPETHC